MRKYEIKIEEIKEQIMGAGPRNVNQVTIKGDRSSQCRKMRQAVAVSAHQQAERRRPTFPM
jgi:hypothetical protein